MSDSELVKVEEVMTNRRIDVAKATNSQELAEFMTTYATNVKNAQEKLNEAIEQFVSLKTRQHGMVNRLGGIQQQQRDQELVNNYVALDLVDAVLSVMTPTCHSRASLRESFINIIRSDIY